MSRSKLLASSFVGLLVLAACGGDDDDKPKVGNGVNDVRAACDQRAQWNRTEECNLCEAAVVSPRCECEALAAKSAACIDQAQARQAACPATIDTDCVRKCERSDCDCIERCYADDGCKRASAARDGCIAAACADICQKK